MYTDSSNESIGAVICQLDDDNRLRPVEYMSTTLTTSTQSSDNILVKELKAIIAAVNKFDKYITSRSDTICLCNCEPLVQALSGTKESKASIERMKFRLFRYNITYKSIGGHYNPIADFLTFSLL